MFQTQISVLIVNEISDNIQLDKNTYLGNVEIIKPITSFQVKKISTINSHESAKLKTINNTKSAKAVTSTEEILSEEKDDVKSQDIDWRIIAVIDL